MQLGPMDFVFFAYFHWWVLRWRRAGCGIHPCGSAGWGGASCLIDFFHFPPLSLSIFLCFYVLLLFHPKRGEIRGKADCTSSDKKIGKWNLHSSARISDQWKMWRHGPTIRAAYLVLCFVLFLSSWEMFTQLISPASSTSSKSSNE